MLLKPQSWSCLPMAISTATNIPFADFIKMIGHDGSELVYENKEFRRGFHIQECLDVLLGEGIIATPIEHHYALTPDGIETYTIGTLDQQASRFENHLAQTKRGFFEGTTLHVTKGMVIGHAAAWADHKIIDPRGIRYDFIHRYLYNFTVQKLWRLEWI